MNSQRDIMLNTLKSIMKKAFFLLAAILLLRSGWGALYPAIPKLQGQQSQEVLNPQDDPIILDTSVPPQPSSPFDKPISPPNAKDSSRHPPSPNHDSNKDASLPLTSNTSPPGAHSKSQWAIVYFPYTPLATCKTALTVRSDIASIHSHGFTSIRLHASDCLALYTVGHAAHLHSMRLIIGIHIDSPAAGEGAAGEEEDGLKLADDQITDLLTWAHDPSTSGWNTIELVVIGEDTIFNSLLLAPRLVAFITQTRTRLRDAGYTGPITTTEPIPTLYEHANLLCPILDILASNIHPFFSSTVDAESAGSYVRDALDVLDQICPSDILPPLSPYAPPPSANTPDNPHTGPSHLKPVRPPSLNLETGWPTRGQRNGVAVPGLLEQSVAVKGIMKVAGGRSTVIGWGDDGWKDEGELGVEGSWGCEHLFASEREREKGILVEEEEVMEGKEVVVDEQVKIEDRET